MRYVVFDGVTRVEAARRAGETTMRTRLDDVEIDIDIDSLVCMTAPNEVHARRMAAHWDRSLAGLISVEPTID